MTTTSEATEELGFAAALVRMSHLVQHVFADVSRDHDITPQQTQLLCILVGGPVGMTELSRLLHLERSSLTGLVDRVERRGLVSRVRDGRDRRACRVTLTDEGSRLAIESHRDVTGRLDTLAGELPDADRERLASTVTRLLAQHDTAWISHSFGEPPLG
ncbi:MarR family winged helix-turn-helix transcriptional regulator [Streptosporangium sp. NBC_01756]|uniref:MarR family winged helix-turn-helix transcriptional regulator n=1 Tax=Streptosporangium sp. NBC_01756 TaxID=2975950 RepID=UPI002DDC5918|nr:MarR family transcriptional regulator [Streptosporangium sp. NBC_01756]WSC84404.1 MarR family transcriptional regulator [Streptosporangium sp. NBC_01756]